MGFDLGPELLKMLNDGAIDGTTKIGMLVRDDASLVSDATVDVLRIHRVIS